MDDNKQNTSNGDEKSSRRPWWRLRERMAKLRGPRLAVWTVLKCHANKEATAWPSLKLMADESGYGERTVRRSIEWLVDHGWLESVGTGHSKGGRFSARRFVVLDGNELETDMDRDTSDYLRDLRFCESRRENPLPDGYLRAIDSDKGWWNCSGMGETYGLAQALRFLRIDADDARLGGESKDFKWPVVRVWHDYQSNLAGGEFMLAVIGNAEEWRIVTPTPTWWRDLTVERLVADGEPGSVAKSVVEPGAAFGCVDRLRALNFYRGCRFAGVEMAPSFGAVKRAFSELVAGYVMRQRLKAATRDIHRGGFITAIRENAEAEGIIVAEWWPRVAGVSETEVAPEFREDSRRSPGSVEARPTDRVWKELLEWRSP